VLNLYKLEIFALVVEEGSFSAAASRLLMTQSAVSQHIQGLESALGTRLFHRGRRGVTLTPAGETLYGYTRRIFQLVAEAESAVTDVEHLAGGQVTLGATPGISVYLLPDHVQSFRGRYPRLTVALQTGITPGIVTDVLAHRLDAGLIEGELDDTTPSRLSVIPLETVEQRVIVGPRHPWWQRSEVGIHDLSGQTFIMRQPGSQTRIWLDGVLKAHDIQPQIGAEFDNLESIKRAVSGGQCLSILPEYAVRHEIEGGSLRAVAVEDSPFKRTLKLIWDRERPFSPVSGAFLAHLSAHFPPLAAANFAGEAGDPA
jgi:LysR family transcriptional regulator, low CO2-responsive transcriptional regulator